MLEEEEGLNQQDLQQLTEEFLGLFVVYSRKGLLFATGSHLTLRTFYDYLFDFLELVGILHSKKVQAKQQVTEADRHFLP